MNPLPQVNTLVIKVVICLFYTFAIQHNAAAQSLPDIIELEYEVTLGAAELGGLSSKLIKLEDYYEATAETHTEGMASILLGGTVREYCRFTVDNNVVTPESYRIVREGQDAFDRKVGFNWDERAVEFSNGEKITISDGYIVDNCSVPFALIAGGASAFENRVLHIVGGTKVRKFDNLGVSRERVKTALGEFDTVKIEQVRFERPDRKLTFWLAPDRHNLPVKIVEQRKSRLDTTMLLKSVKGL